MFKRKKMCPVCKSAQQYYIDSGLAVSREALAANRAELERQAILLSDITRQAAAHTSSLDEIRGALANICDGQRQAVVGLRRMCDDVRGER